MLLGGAAGAGACLLAGVAEDNNFESPVPPDVVGADFVVACPLADCTSVDRDIIKR